MKDTIKDANFPKTGDGRVYHLGVKYGEVANRIITVGDPARARIIAQYLDTIGIIKGSTTVDPTTGQSNTQNHGLFALHSERGFLTITGTYKGIPVSIVSIGMGAPNMDFFVRECREVIEGDMVIVRLGSCGGLVEGLPVGSLTIPKASRNVTRNYDFDFHQPPTESSHRHAYHIWKPVPADPLLQETITQVLKQVLPSVVIRSDLISSSADSFYSSQGRITAFPDHNAALVDYVIEQGVSSLEMETFHLFHLAACWQSSAKNEATHSNPAPPISPSPEISIDGSSSNADSTEATTESVNGTNTSTISHTVDPKPVIRAAAVQMIFADRTTREFITPEQVHELENATAKGLLEAITTFTIPDERLHPVKSSVWNV